MTQSAEPYTYNPRRFENTARFYTTGRPRYPALLARRVAQLVGVGREHAARRALAPFADANGHVHEVLEGHALVARRAGEA